MGRVLITPNVFHPDAVALLENEGHEVIFSQPTQSLNADALRGLIHGFDAYVAGSNPITANVINQANKLKIIARFGVGYDNVDWKYAFSKGIQVTVTAGANEQSVADMTFALLLGISRKIPYFDRTVRGGGWTPLVLGVESWNKSIGIIGTGRIGKAVAQRARGFDMKVLAYDVYPDKAWAERMGVKYVPLEELVSTSDYVTLHTPLTNDTNKMVSRSFLEKMKPSAYLINTARGSLVDEEALYEALVTNQIAGAAMDVYDGEPVRTDHPLLGIENCLFTCHVSSHTNEAFKRMSFMCAEEIRLVLCGEKPQHLIPELR